MRIPVILLPLLLILAACASPRLESRLRTTHLSRAEVLNYFSKQPTDVTFVSHNGHMYGFDLDARLILKKNNRSEVTEFQDAKRTYQGSYVVDDTGAVQVALRRYPKKWPSMYLYTDKRGAFLFPSDRKPPAKVGGRARVPYWLFRQNGIN